MQLQIACFCKVYMCCTNVYGCKYKINFIKKVAELTILAKNGYFVICLNKGFGCYCV